MFSIKTLNKEYLKASIGMLINSSSNNSFPKQVVTANFNDDVTPSVIVVSKYIN